MNLLGRVRILHICSVAEGSQVTPSVQQSGCGYRNKGGTLK